MTKIRVLALLAPVALAVGVWLPAGGSAPAAASTGLTYGFTAPPIAPAGSIAPGKSVSFTLRVLNNGVLDPGGLAYIGYFQAGHVAGDTTVLQCAAGNVVLPVDGSLTACNAGSNGKITLVYTVPAQPVAQGRADWVAQATSQPGGGNHAVEHYVYCTVYRFNPSPITGTQSVTLSARDGLGNPIPADTVFLSFKGAGGAAVGGAPLTTKPILFTTDATGQLTIAFTAGSGTGTISVQDLATGATEKNSDSYSPSAPVVSVGDVNVVEGDQLPGIPAQFTVSISPVQATDTTVQYVTLCGIGDKGCGEDFVQVNVPVTVTIPANTSSTTILVRQFSYIGGNAGEAYPEGWFVELENPSVGVVGRSVGNGMLSADVENTNVALPYLYVGDAGAMPTVDHAGGIPVYFTVTLGAVESTNVSFTYATADASAMAGTDYTALLPATGTVVAGNTSTVITVMLLPNSPPPTNRTFRLIISNAPAGIIISTATGTGTILAA